MNSLYCLNSIHSQVELLRKKHALDQQNLQKANDDQDESNDASDDFVASGLGDVRKDCGEEELIDWGGLLAKWRETVWSERPKGLQQLVHRGIPDAVCVLFLIRKSHADKIQIK